MEHSNIIVETDNLICTHLSNNDRIDAKAFEPANENSGFLAGYIKNQAFIKCERKTHYS